MKECLVGLFIIKNYLGIFDPGRQIVLLYKVVVVLPFNFGSLTDNNLLQDIEAIGWVPGSKIMFCCKFKVRKSLLQIVRMKTLKEVDSSKKKFTFASQKKKFHFFDFKRNKNMDSIRCNVYKLVITNILFVL